MPRMLNYKLEHWWRFSLGSNSNNQKVFVNSNYLSIFDKMKNQTIHIWWWNSLRQHVVK